MPYDMEVLEAKLVGFGEKIKSIRNDKGVSLDVISAETGITKSYLSRLERGQRLNPSFLVVYILCDYYDIPIKEIVN